MSKDFPVQASLQLDEFGRALLSDDILSQIEEHAELVRAGAGTNYVYCPGGSNGNCTNNLECSRTINSICSNSGLCNGSSNNYCQVRLDETAD